MLRGLQQDPSTPHPACTAERAACAPEAVPPATPIKKGSERVVRRPLRRAEAGLSSELGQRSSTRLCIMPCNGVPMAPRN